MKFVETPLAGAFVVELDPRLDDRGFFMRTFCAKEFAEIGFCKQILQINHSYTRKKGTVRGLHYQRMPACETKIVRCVRGEVFDVIVDLRPTSASFMKWYGVNLSRDGMKMIYIPEGFAHGFQTLTSSAELIYCHSAFYDSTCEGGVRFDDPLLSIEWPLSPSNISPRDNAFPFIQKDFGGIEA